MPPTCFDRLTKATTATAAVLALLLAASPAAAGGPESIELHEGETTLNATIYRPEGTGPFPAVIGMHDCAGLMNGAGAVAVKYRDWAQLLVKAGFIVLYPESYSSRGLGNQCTSRNRPVRPERERVADANVARGWLAQQPDVQADHISLLGWSNGGNSVLWAVRPRPATNEKPDFRSAVALYPGCRRLNSTAWSARVPTLILIGAFDDVSSAQDCERMVAGAKGRSARISLVVYPAAFHDFDHPNRPLQVRTDYAFSSDGTGRIRSGTNASARADSLKRVPQWLAR
jgi:dienelactone hydrolase